MKRDIKERTSEDCAEPSKEQSAIVTPEFNGCPAVLLIAVWYMCKDSLHTVIYNSETLKTILKFQFNKLKNYIWYAHNKILSRKF